MVAAPTLEHFAICRFFLENGKHVMVEKPISRTLAEADELIALAAAKKRVLAVGHLERFNPAVRVRRRGWCDKPLFIEVQRLGSFSPRSLDIDVIMDLMIHDLDIILQWDRSGVREIRASGVPIISRRIDIANVRLEFHSGLVANLTASRVSQEKTRKLRIFQKNLYLSVDYKARSVKMFQLRDGQILEEFPAHRGCRAAGQPVAQLRQDGRRRGRVHRQRPRRPGGAAAGPGHLRRAAGVPGMLERFVRRQIEKKTFPGVSILAAAGDESRFTSAASAGAPPGPHPSPWTADTLYDLASLTKPLVTAFLAVYFIEKKQWRLDDEARRFLPALALPVTLGQLLTHSAGLQPWHPFYLYRPQDDLAQIAALDGVVAAGNAGRLFRHRLYPAEAPAGKNFRRRLPGAGRPRDLRAAAACATPSSACRRSGQGAAPPPRSATVMKRACAGLGMPRRRPASPGAAA